MASARRGEQGQTIVLIVVFMFVLLGMCAMAIDVGIWYQDKRSVQATADAGSGRRLGAAGELAGAACSAADEQSVGRGRADRQRANRRFWIPRARSAPMSGGAAAGR